MSIPRSAATGAMTLLTEYDEASGQEVRSLRLEPASDGKAVLLIEIDERKPGIHREVRYEITPAELIAAIRAHGAELPGEQHSR
jgi:Mrp family chromosome partitioning ATPase